MTRWSVVVVSMLSLIGGLAYPAAPAMVTALPCYVDPAKTFAIKHPQGWKVRRDQGVTTFYESDPDEGTGIDVLPAGSVQGGRDATGILKMLVDPGRIAGTVHSQPGNAKGTTVADGVLLWTNKYRVPMKGRAYVGAFPPTRGRTNFTYQGYQAPRTAFDETEKRIFRPMLATLRLGGGNCR